MDLFCLRHASMIYFNLNLPCFLSRGTRMPQLKLYFTLYAGHMTPLLLLIPEPNGSNRITQNSGFRPMIAMLSKCEWRVSGKLEVIDN